MAYPGKKTSKSAEHIWSAEKRLDRSLAHRCPLLASPLGGPQGDKIQKQWCATAPALMTTALLASAAAPCAPMRAHFDSAATAHMGPDARFLRDARPSNVGIEVYNNEVVTNNMEGEFISHVCLYLSCVCNQFVSDTNILVLKPGVIAWST